MSLYWTRRWFTLRNLFFTWWQSHSVSVGRQGDIDSLFPPVSDRFFTPTADGTRDNTLRLTFADKSPEHLEEAAHLLGLALHTLLERGQSVYPSLRLTTDV